MRSRSSWFGLAVVTSCVMAAPALANEANYSFKMEFRYVSGEKNDVEHSLDRGLLTITGQVWTTQCAGGAMPAPVTIEVWEDGLIDHLLCSFSATPSKTMGQKVSFSTSCGSVSTSRFFVVAYKVHDEGCDIEAAGTLTTK
jgi:hypothetical protein